MIRRSLFYRSLMIHAAGNSALQLDTEVKSGLDAENVF